MPPSQEDRRISFPAWLEWDRGEFDSHDDLSHLLDDESTSDMIVRCPGQDFKCHQIALLQPRCIGFSVPPQTVIPLANYTLTMLEPLNASPPPELPECPICMEPIRKPVATPCAHVFHEHCINKTIKLQKKCPMCRDPIDHPSWCMKTEMPAPAPRQAGIEVDCDQFTMRRILCIIYAGHYAYGMRDHWSPLPYRHTMLPRCYRWQLHFDVFVAAVQLEIDFADMQNQSLFAYSCLVREFALLPVEPRRGGETAKQQAEREVEDGNRLCWASIMLQEGYHVDLDDDAQIEAVLRPLRHIWKVYGAHMLEDDIYWSDGPDREDIIDFWLTEAEQ